MNPQITQTAANVSTAATVTSGAATAGISFAEWVTSNSIIIGVACTVLSLMTAITFHLINAYQTRKHNINSHSLAVAERISKWRDEGKSEDEIRDILKLAGIDYAE